MDSEAYLWVGKITDLKSSEVLSWIDVHATGKATLRLLWPQPYYPIFNSQQYFCLQCRYRSLQEYCGTSLLFFFLYSSSFCFSLGCSAVFSRRTGLLHSGVCLL
ncbi:hypothetical protein MPTK1_8g04120 [Marchantia polymorpha subsp. ruderalis]|uniref:Uncharacterized protein n=1 Tax=Marchantia polymorpha TaxID=3197 RepID=A0A2R6XJH5_MARPO|nr:hypothetical protein MARPO_0012s0201 [Marchantia polymorpha]BBN18633.1 hypothetical protein Mp_8g04120 [Marchantia polymorpha subsp. ruderalis]PTQ46281.1 hypothetical protein MARPO_0012s0201 [Marchantia polymorpha]PTQ46282.1 hypothetical protein MARPO_0012s0201 [Marchantia polymorpha]BBN18634.1 hypothetical protein Mp_8g04120 [Marchantia polymorpha subsp. ruderalis]|eukprot:PTQ46280.1 hypothetical protein MARPO_0012s0201 [Marchantia polymorpha]